MDDLHLVAYSSALAWVMLLTASLARTRAWTWRGLAVAVGTRGDVPESSPFAARADRAANNMLENLVLFVALVVAAHLSAAPAARIDGGAKVFFWARVAYFPVYLAAIPYLRTAIWLVSVAGLAMILSTML